MRTVERGGRGRPRRPQGGARPARRPARRRRRRRSPRGCVAATRAAWRAGAAARLPELHEAVQERARTSGEVAFLLEPDLKEARGGLRDVHALSALAVAQVADVPPAAVREAHAVLLDVRGELHRRTARAGRRPVDRLLLQEQAGRRRGARAAPTPTPCSGRCRRPGARSRTRPTPRGGGPVRPRPRRRLLGRREPARRPLAEDVVEQAGEAVLARDARPELDPVLPLRVAQAAARAGLPVSPATLEVLAARCPPLPEPWPSRRARRAGGPAGRRPGCGRRRSRPWTTPACSSRCCPSGRPCAPARSATPSTATPSTGTSPRRLPPPPA